MDINKVLKIVKYSCPDSCLNGIGHVSIKQGALQELCTLIRKYAKVVFVTDTETYNMCGIKIVNMLGDKLEKFALYESGFESDEPSLEKLRLMIGSETELILGAGGETVQNICKYESRRAKLPYYMAAAFPSSVKCICPEAVLIKNHEKHIYPAQTPRAVIADTNIMKFIDYAKLKNDYEEMKQMFFRSEAKLTESANKINCSEDAVKMFSALKERFDEIESGLRKQELKAVEKFMEMLLILEAVNYDLKRIA